MTSPLGFNALSVTRSDGKRATRPCPCGLAGDREQECRYTPDQVRRVARTLADLGGTEVIGTSQVAEAISLRAERQIGGGSTARQV